MIVVQTFNIHQQLNPTPLPMKLPKLNTPLTPNHDQGSNHKHKRRRQNADCNVRSHHPLKASNIPATIFSVGSWKRHFTHQGNLTVKLYFGRRKLVWEFLDGELMKKMEVSWSDITALNAIVQPGQPGVLQIELGRPPLFFQEKELEPLVHTKWKPTSDFTEDQASYYRINRTTFPKGVLDEHLKKLLESDERLLELSQKPFPSQDSSPYFNSSGGLKQTGLAYATTSTPYVPFQVSPPTNSDMGGSDHHDHEDTAWVNIQDFQEGGVVNPALFRNQHDPMNPNAHTNLQFMQNDANTIYGDMNLENRTSDLQIMENNSSVYDPMIPVSHVNLQNNADIDWGQIIDQRMMTQNSSAMNIHNGHGYLYCSQSVDQMQHSRAMNIPNGHGNLYSSQSVDQMQHSRAMNIPNAYGNLYGSQSVDHSAMNIIPNANGNLYFSLSVDEMQNSGAMNIPNGHGNLYASHTDDQMQNSSAMNIPDAHGSQVVDRSAMNIPNAHGSLYSSQSVDEMQNASGMIPNGNSFFKSCCSCTSPSQMIPHSHGHGHLYGSQIVDQMQNASAMNIPNGHGNLNGSQVVDQMQNASAGLLPRIHGSQGVDETQNARADPDWLLPHIHGTAPVSSPYLYHVHIRI